MPRSTSSVATYSARSYHEGMDSQPIYLDYNATTPIDPAVVEAMLPYLRVHHGNPSSTHEYGRLAHDAVEVARQQCADLLGAQPDEIVFTSGGSEASNLALKGTAFQRVGRGLLEGALSGLLRRGQVIHIVTSAIEHPATAATCDFLRRLG